ncbi:MAG: tetratricopeptide repeat protein [Bacteroidales bacterium]|jgi:tetratricopeptide (TPR) repeat protein|nr:tetratricopeptide repeat protein [Bacteroidales bacterium]
MKQFFLEHKKDPFFVVFIAIIAILLFVMPFLAKNAGMSGDEEVHLKQAENVINYYSSFGKDTAALAFSPEWNLPQYGQAVDNIASLVARIIHADDVMMVRHVVNALFGWLGVLIAGLICFRVSKKWRAALIGSLFLFLSPRFLGHSFNNLKDLSFATMMLVGVYLIIVYCQNFPKIKKSLIVYLAIAVGFSIAIRVGGLLLIPYFGLFAAVYFVQQYSFKGLFVKPTNKLFGKMVLHGLIILAGGYLIAMLLWPYALVSPYEHVKETFASMSSFGIALRQLFEGQLIWSDLLPCYYTPKYIFMTIPIAVIIGWIIYPFFGGLKKENRFPTFVLYFACIFPVFWLVYSNANVYGGWRHAMFAYPPMAVIAGLGFNALIDFFKNKYVKIGLTAIPFLLLINPLIHVIKNHPYEYVYFNELAGGMNKAYGNYEGDYYYHSTREATQWIINNAEKSGLETGDKIRVASWHIASVGYYLRNDTAKFVNTFSRWYERGNNDWDYAIFVITGMAPDQIKGEHFPPKNTVYTIFVDDKPICLVLKRDDKSDLKGFQYKQKNVLDSAAMFLNMALEKDPYNDAALMNLIELYFQVGQIDSAKKWIDFALTYLPTNETINYFLAHYYLIHKDYDNSINTLNFIIKNNIKFKGAYHLLCNNYLQQNNLKMAEKTLLRMIDIDLLDDQGVKQLIEIYKAQGMNDAMAYKRLYKIMEKNFLKRGKKTEAKLYGNYARQIR